MSSRVQTAVTMRQVTGSMANVVRGMDSAMKSMDLEKVGETIPKASWSELLIPWADLSSNGPLRDAI